MSAEEFSVAAIVFCLVAMLLLSVSGGDDDDDWMCYP